MLPIRRQDLEKHTHPSSIFRPAVPQFLTLCLAVFVFYVGYGFMQELIFRLDGMQPFGWYLTLIQFMLYSGLSFGEMKVTTGIVRRIPWKVYMQLAFYTVATMGLSNASVGYLNYPTQVIFKCCKLIPVLIGGILIQGKRYGIWDLAAAALMSLGLIMFSLADSHVSPNFDPRGYVMISLALVADAIIGNVQEKAMKNYSANNSEVVLYSYSIGSLYILGFVVVTGEFFDAFVFFIKHPIETYGYIFIFSLLGFAGVNIVLTLVKTTGALVAVTGIVFILIVSLNFLAVSHFIQWTVYPTETLHPIRTLRTMRTLHPKDEVSCGRTRKMENFVTTMRKAVTIIVSFLIFSKPFTVDYVWAGLVILLAIYLNLYSKNRTKWNAAIVNWWHGRHFSPAIDKGKLIGV
uniref:Adenosine 3'-phospho 5'-phosphosulfate transporter 2 n=1 Tax=Acrobeloides nanus TaxID=290746 RepID=A0A914C1N3_9BILA